jgi:hypothetical protein
MKTEEYLAAEVTAAINDGKVYKLEFHGDGSGVGIYLYTLTGNKLVSLRMETFIECTRGVRFEIRETSHCF